MTGSATLTSDAEEGQAGAAPSPARAAARPFVRADGVAGAAQLACVLEASAEKPGNITPSHDFADTSYEDMLRSAIALGPELARAGERGVGETVRAVVEATRRVAPANTNLGIALLLAPLAKAALARRRRCGRGSRRCCARSTSPTRAPRTRRSGSPARAACDEPVEHDVRAEPTVGLREAMASAAERDSIASEYATDYALTFEHRAPGARAPRSATGWRPRDAIVELHLRLLAAVARHADRAQARRRRRGAGVGGRARGARRRRRPHAAGAALQSFDASLRADGNALNPGTTADLVTATVCSSRCSRVARAVAPSEHSS